LKGTALRAGDPTQYQGSCTLQPAPLTQPTVDAPGMASQLEEGVLPLSQVALSPSQ
jgi:hypothetical protein